MAIVSATSTKLGTTPTMLGTTPTMLGTSPRPSYVLPLLRQATSLTRPRTQRSQGMASASAVSSGPDARRQPPSVGDPCSAPRSGSMGWPAPCRSRPGRAQGAPASSRSGLEYGNAPDVDRMSGVGRGYHEHQRGAGRGILDVGGFRAYPPTALAVSHRNHHPPPPRSAAPRCPMSW